MEFNLEPNGPFDLLFQNQFFNGWPTLEGDDSTVAMAFPVEGWDSYAGVTLHQLPGGALRGKIYGASDNDKAKHQALAALSLDQDGSQWPLVGQRDHFIGQLQQQYHLMRPSMFHSPYEASAAFIIGHRISIGQARVIRSNLAEQHGEAITIGRQTFHAFPLPQSSCKLVTLRA